MAGAIETKIKTQMKLMGSMFGVKFEEENDSGTEDFDYKKMDTSLIDSIDNRKFDELMKNA